jgi:hypothetical protein
MIQLLLFIVRRRRGERIGCQASQTLIVNHDEGAERGVSRFKEINMMMM